MNRREELQNQIDNLEEARLILISFELDTDEIDDILGQLEHELFQLSDEYIDNE